MLSNSKEILNLRLVRTDRDLRPTPSTKRNHRRSEQLHSSEEGAGVQQACAGDALEHTHLGCSRVGKEPSLLL